MTHEDLKLLAEWYYEKEYFSVSMDWIYYEGDIDSNQLDLLEDKMLKETKVFLMKLFVLENGAYTVKFRTNTLEDFSFAGDGSTKNEARLNAILNYIKREK